jgi:hypothetical protein
MLGVRTYTKKYVNECRAKVESDLAAYKAANAKSLEVTFFNNMVLVIDHLFLHRLRAVEGKDGNPLNEVRILADGMLNNHGKLAGDKTIKYVPEDSVLKYKLEDEIKVNEAQFTALYKAFFAEIESKYL